MIPKCTSSTVAISYWREAVTKRPGFDPVAESFWVLTLHADRRLTGAHAVNSRAFGDSARFVDELFGLKCLRGAPEFLLIHHRPRVVPEGSATDVERVRSVILAGRLKKTELLDCLIVGKPDGHCLSGVLSFHRIRGFSAEVPFSKAAKKPGQSGAKTGIRHD